MKKSSTDGSEIRPYQRDVIGRRALPHDPPLSIDTNKEVFFITICCKQRGKNQLCHSAVVSVLVEAVRFYEGNHKWFVHLMVVMPDHVHFLASFAMDVKIKDLMRVGNDSRLRARKFIGSVTSSIIVCVATRAGVKKLIIFSLIQCAQDWRRKPKTGLTFYCRINFGRDAPPGRPTYWHR